MSMIFWYLPLGELEAQSIISQPDIVEHRFFEQHKDLLSDLDKAWGVVHSVLTSGIDDFDHPLGFIMFGGCSLGQECPSFRYLTSSELVAVDQELKKIDRESFLTRLAKKDPAAEELLPGVWEGVDEDAEYLADMYEKIASDIAKSSRKREAWLVCLA